MVIAVEKAQFKGIYIAGIGAIGTLIASNLDRSGNSVRLILKNEKAVRDYQQTGLEMLVADQRYISKPPAISLQECSLPISLLICCVKAHDIAGLLYDLRHCLNEQSIVILIHNGMGVLEEVESRVPHLRLVSGITTLGGYLQAPYKGVGFLSGKTSLGALKGVFSSEEITDMTELFHRSGLHCEWVEFIAPVIWDKFAINCSINILTVLWSCKNGHLLTRMKELEQLVAEVALVLEAYQIPITYSYLLDKVIHILNLTAGNYSSTYQDIKKGRQTEINYLNRYLVSLAAKKNIAVPYSEKLLQQFQAHELRAIPHGVV